jgi:hypothetical protein
MYEAGICINFNEIFFAVACTVAEYFIMINSVS